MCAVVVALNVLVSPSSAAVGGHGAALDELASSLDEPAKAADRDAVAAAFRELAPSGGHEDGNNVARAQMSASTVERQATWVDTYHDTCDDGSADLHSTDIIEDSEGMYGFMFSTCPSSSAAFTGTSMMWLVDVNFDRSFEYGVQLFFDWSGAYTVAVLDIRSADSDQWYLTYSGPASWDRPESMNGGHLGVGVVPWDALGFAGEFLFDSRLYAADDRYDELPEVGEDYLLWPYSCDQTIWRQSTVRTEPGRTVAVADALRAVGVAVTSVAPGVGTFAVSDLSNHQQQLLAQVDGVVSVERSKVRKLAALNDPEPTQWALDQMRAEAGWAVRGSAAVRVAVLDDGVDSTRRDLSGRVAEGRDAVFGYDLPAGVNSDRGGHGTAVAGVIAAARGNGVEVAGMNPQATIVPYRITDASGCVSDAAIIAALDDIATRRTADVVNISVGGAGTSTAERDALTRVLRTGIPVIASSGNDGSSTPNYPAAHAGVISVGATGPDGAVTAYSNRGSNVLVVAPGGSGSATRSSDIGTLADFDALDYVSGTSFSAPYVAGAVSLYLGIRPGTSPADLSSKLAQTSTDIAPSGRDAASGYGRLNLEAFLKSAGTSSSTPPPPSGPAGGGFDGDPTTTERLDTSDVFRAAVATSTQRFGSDRPARHVVLARSDQFADALAGAALTGEGPLLFAFPDRVPDFVLAEIDRVLPGGGRVYLLGGEAALNGNVVNQLRARGHSPARLHGGSRIETATAVADQVVALYGQPAQVLIARAYGPATNPTAAWADAIAAGSYAASRNVPLLLTGTDDLHPASKAWLDHRPNATRVLLGGEAAVSMRVEQQVGGTRQRIAGADRAETAVKIADLLWRQPTSGLRNYVVFNGFYPSGWAFGLATAGIAADADAPILVVSPDHTPASTADRVAGCDNVDLYIAGSESVVPAQRQAELDARDRARC